MYLPTVAKRRHRSSCGDCTLGPSTKASCPLSLSLTYSFRRVFCVFINEEEAELVKCALNGCLLEGHRLDVYFGEVVARSYEC